MLLLLAIAFASPLTWMPAAAPDGVVFVADDDLWRVGPEGGTAVRLTSADGHESNPFVSSDGRWIAYTSTWEGNLDVWVMPAHGGEARRLTWHPGRDEARGFTPDGAAVLYSSDEGAYTGRHRRLYTVPVGGGVPTLLPVPHGFDAALSPDGSLLAYTPQREAFTQWKGYRGGTQSRIWLLRLADLSVVEVPKPPGGSNDTNPLWVGADLLFTSDRAGEFNLFRYKQGSREVSQLTRLEEFPVRAATAAPDGSVVFEHGGSLYRASAGGGAPRLIPVEVPADMPEARPRWVSGSWWARSLAGAPGLERVAVELRGEIITFAAEHGDPRPLTASPGAHDRSPAWSPDGRQVAWMSDEGGEYALWLRDQDGRAPARRVPLEGAGYYEQPVWSPDGARIAYQDNSQSLWVVELATGVCTKVAQEPVYSPVDLMSAAWSPDSRWLAYTLRADGLLQSVLLWSTESGQSVALTDGLAEVAEPVFDPGGELLYVLASTDAGPLRDWFSQISSRRTMKHGVYAITLRRDGPSALPPRSDEPKVEAEPEKKGEKKSEKKADKKPDKALVRVDVEGVRDRIVALPVGEAARRNLRVGKAGELWFLETVGRRGFEVYDGPARLQRYRLEDRTLTTVATNVDGFDLSADGGRVLYGVGGSWYVQEAADSLSPGEGRLALEAAQVRVEPRAEWAQILDEAWRINRDWFYAPNFHGADWPAMREKYRALLPRVARRSDLDQLLQMMLSELAVGHSYLTPGEDPGEPAWVGAGLLGADYAVHDGRWRFERIYGGLPWSGELRAPLRTPGVDVAEGEYLLAIDGVDLVPPTSVHALLQHKADRSVRITVGPRADGKGSRELTVVPVSGEHTLRYLAWVDKNLRYVTERTDGRVAYVHVPDTAEYGHDMFVRLFYPQSGREALILDERHNGGGLVADMYIEALMRPPVARWVMRYGEDLVTPRATIQGPKVMIADETAGSGGDLLPWMFQRFELGPVVGKTTWGGLVGILGYPTLMDGTQITAPNLAIWTEDGFRIENEGVKPDVEMEQWPADVAAGRDPQLDKAIELALAALAASPREEPVRPPWPVRAR